MSLEGFGFFHSIASCGYSRNSKLEESEEKKEEEEEAETRLHH